MLIHDGEYTPDEYRTFIDWGHSVYTDALRLALKANVSQLALFHLNQDRTDNEMDHIIADCRNRISAKGSSLKCVGAAADMEFKL